jgi:hypothetical protein
LSFELNSQLAAKLRLMPLTFSSSKLSSQQAEYAFEEQLEFKLEDCSHE